MKARLAVFAGAFALLFATPVAATQVKTIAAVKGVDVWFVEDHTVPMVALQASLPAGSAYDPRGKWGLADFAAAMLDEGAANLDSKAFHAALDDRAIQLSVAVDRDYLRITLLTESANAKVAFHLLALALQRPRFDSEAVARIRAQLLQNIASENEQPANVAMKAFYATYFGAHPYAHSPGGDTQGVNAVTPNDLRAFVRSHWVRNGAKISVAGDMGSDVLAKNILLVFGALPDARAQPPPAATGPSGTEREIKMGVPQPAIVFGLRGPLRSDPDFVPALVANYVLGGGSFASRLTNEVRVKRGLTYDISTDLLAYRGAGLLVGNVGTRKDAVRQSVAVIRDVLTKFAANGVTEQELADAKTYLKGSFPLSFSSDSGTVAQLNTFQCEGLTTEYAHQRNDLIESVMPDDIRRVAKRFFNPARLTVVIAGTPTEPPRAKTHH